MRLDYIRKVKNDYYVIVYRVLMYLYNCLRQDEVVDMQKLTSEYLPYIIQSHLYHGELYYFFISNIFSITGILPKSEISSFDITTKLVSD